MPAPVALIIGITGQDGSFLAELLLGKGHAVHGLHRRTSLPNLGNLAGLNGRATLHHGDLTEGGSLLRVLQRVRPNEIYNLAAPSLATGSAPQQAAELHVLGTQRLLDALRLHDPVCAVRLYQSSSHGIFGRGANGHADEATACHPDTATDVARLQARWLVEQARERDGMHASSGICFPHGSARAAPDAPLRHIARAVGQGVPLLLNALDARQNWGHARDHADAMWRMLQQDRPGDFVLAAGPGHSLRHVVERAFAIAGISLRWEGAGWDETGSCARSGRLLVRLAASAPGWGGPLGDSGRARRLLGWDPPDALVAVLTDLLEDERGMASGTIGGRRHGPARAD